MICELRRGHLFSEENSATYTKTSDIIEAGGAPDEVTFTGSELGVRKLVLSSLAGTDTI
jgi:hypothetical protein